MSHLKLAALCTLILMIGCTTQPTRTASDEPDLQCQRVELTGTMVAKKVCTTRAERADHQAQLEDLRERVRSVAGDNPHPAAPTAQ